MLNRPKPFALIILDGWGHREQADYNAIAEAKKPFWDTLWTKYPHLLLDASGSAVGLPEGQMGNSEVGHLTIGAGRTIHQDLTRIDLAIKDKTFFANPVLTRTIQNTLREQKAIHILGLLSPGGVHSHEKHLIALLQLLSEHKASKVYIHAFLDGRDTPPRSAEMSLQTVMQTCQTLRCGKIVSVIGRYYAMDRDKRYERIQKAYDLITQGIASYSTENPLSALKQAYERGENDEFVSATVVHQKNDPPVTMQDGDAVIFMNFRADRAREITASLINPDFNSFQRNYWPKVHFVTLTEYDTTFKVDIIFPPEPLTHLLGEYFSELGFKQLRIAETEKYAHVTFFFNGGNETPSPGEERLLIPSPHIATYDLQPEMSALIVTEKLVEAIQSQQYDVIICNFANPDMVGHTGNLPATIQAIEVMDRCLQKIITALQTAGGEAFITADHGNAEVMFDPNTQQPHTAHTQEKVPLIYVGRSAGVVEKSATLADIAPSMLDLMNLTIPQEMTGTPLFKIKD